MKASLYTALFILMSLFAVPSHAMYDAKHPGWDKHKATIVKASAKAKVDPATMAAMASIESGFKTGAKNKSSTAAAGLYQFKPRTWRVTLKKYGKLYGIPAGTSVYNPMANALMGAEYIKENRRYLETKLRRPIDSSEIFMAHLLGPGGAEKMLKAKSNRLARDINPSAARYNKSYFYSKGKALTVSQFRVALRTKVDRQKTIYGDEARTIALLSHDYDTFKVARR